MSYLPDIPDHPDIRKMEAYGTLNPEDDFIPHCPVCGEECETLYQDCNREIVGCDNCVEHFDAYDYLVEQMEEEGADDEE